jgi:putative Ca2+/H+ antiporter (TMEM165/GDT1 family)
LGFVPAVSGHAKHPHFVLRLLSCCQKWTHYIAALLFLVFGVKMLQEGFAIPAGSSHIQEEMREVEDELEEEEGMMDLDGRKAALDMEEGHADGNSIVLNDFAKPSSSKKVHIRAHPLSAPGHSKSPAGKVKARLSVKELKNSTRNFCGLFFSPVFAQAFILTFLGEWGDRSQIATIALAGVNVGDPPPSLCLNANHLSPSHRTSS